MLTDTLQIPRHRLYAFQDEELPPERQETLSRIVQRRLRREPLAYILEHKEFYGIDLIVGPEVLIPRPETELLVERAMVVCLERMDKGEPVVVEVGTGCGGICINLAVHLPRAKIFATELYPGALRIAKSNVRRHKVEDRITLLQGDLLLPIKGTVDVIVANLPYVRRGRREHLQPEMRWEPWEALDGGPDGLDVMRRLLSQARDKLSQGGVILLEMDPEQVKPLHQFARKLFPDTTTSVEQDLAGLDRIFVVERQR